MFAPAGAAKLSHLNALAHRLGLSGRMMWFDAEANLSELSSREGVRCALESCNKANIDTVIVDVKPLSGFVLYNSSIAPRMPGYPQGYDLLAVVLDEAPRFGVAVYAAVNVFSEGSAKRPSGPAFDHPERQCIQLQPDGLRLVSELTNEHMAVFVNPANPDAAQYELAILHEIASNYPVQGIVLDRMRYPNKFCDFSDYTRRGIEQMVGERVRDWPDDVCIRQGSELVPRRLFGHWLLYRAGIIRAFLERARVVVKSANPTAALGAYVGSWYPYYWDVGVNWAGPKHIAQYDWWPDGYEKTGYADLVDFLCPGCYYPDPTRAEAAASGLEEWRSVEAGLDEASFAVEDACFSYGSIYLRDYIGSPDRLARAINLCLENSQGCMLFDLVHARENNQWPTIAQCFSGLSGRPHEDPRITQMVTRAESQP